MANIEDLDPLRRTHRGRSTAVYLDGYEGRQ